MKILIALQYWEGDKAQAEKLATFLTDLQAKHSEHADFLLINRYDCIPPTGLAQYVARKFNTFTYRAPRGMTGWPAGCNSLWANTLQWVKCMSEAKKCPRYKAIFTCEGDGGPVFPDWVERLSKAWDVANSKGPVCMAGPLVKIPAEHINGNALMSGDPEMLKWLVRLALNVPATGGWDFVLAGEFKRKGWANIPGMVSYYNSKAFSVEQYLKMQSDNLIWCHGDKSNALVDLGRIFLLGAKTPSL